MVVKVVVAVFAVIGLGATGVFGYKLLNREGEHVESVPLAVSAEPVIVDGFATDLVFTTETRRDAVSEHGVQCDSGWDVDENGAEICVSDGKYYAVLADPIERVLDGYVSGPLLEEDPDQYVIATPDAALIVPGDDMGWLFKVWDDCVDCYGWRTGSGRDVAVEFTHDGLKTLVDGSVDCYWDFHGNRGFSTCSYSEEATGKNRAAMVFDAASTDGLTAMELLHEEDSFSILGADAGFQFFTDEAYRFLTPPVMRACQLAGPCYVQIGSGEVWEFNPSTPEEVDSIFAAR